MSWVVVIWLSLLLIIHSRSFGNRTVCPSGHKPTQKCSISRPCLAMEFCIEFEDNQQGCCAEPFCVETGMLSIVRQSGSSIEWLYEEHLSNRWYETMINVNEKIYKGACPKPFAFQLMNFGNEALPVKFKEGGNPIIPCNKSSDCEEDEFCGHAYNPSFCDDGILTKFKNRCLDMSNHGKAYTFCYKNEIKEATNLQLKIKNNDVGMILCSTHNDCLKEFPNEKVFCHHGKKMFLEMDADGKPTGKEKEGICVEATVCSKHRHSSTLGSLGIDGKECELEKPETCPGQNVECIAASSSLDYSNFCCELKKSNNLYIWIIVIIVLILVVGAGAGAGAILSKKIFKKRNEDIDEEIALEAAVGKNLGKILNTPMKKSKKEFRNLPDGTSTFSSSNKNAHLNRYHNIPCTEESRIVLKNPKLQNDYINANTIATAKNEKRFICCQAPIKESIVAHFVMCYEQSVKMSLMLCNFTEEGEEKCVEYFPTKLGEKKSFTEGELTIKIRNVDEKFVDGFDGTAILRTLKVEYDNIMYEMKHIHFCQWPDHGVPQSPEGVIKILEIIRSEQNPIVVHCSAGVGRTGTIVGIELMMEKIENEGTISSVVEIVNEMRKKRTKMVQTFPQYLFMNLFFLYYWIHHQKQFNFEHLKEKFEKWNSDYCKEINKKKKK